MNVEIFALCDAANDSHGKLNLLGAFDSVWATIGARRASRLRRGCAPALRANRKRRAPRCDSFHRRRRPDVLHPVEGTIQVNPRAGGYFGRRQYRAQPAWPEASSTIGEYSVNLLIDGEEVAVLPLFVRQPKA